MSEPTNQAPASPPLSDKPPVPWAQHYSLQAEFVKLAQLLGVTITDKMTFAEGVQACRSRAQLAAVKTTLFDDALAFLDGAAEVLLFASKVPDLPAQARADIETARRSHLRAITALRELTGGGRDGQPKP